MASENKFGKVSELKIESEFRDGKTIVSDSFFTPPFKIMLPLYQKDKLTNKEVMRLLLLMASPGIMEGDVQKFSFDIKENSDVEYFTQSYEKVHKMHDGYGTRDVFINMGKNTYFDYHPMPIMPFADSAVFNNVFINFEDETSKLIYEEILCCGRVAYGERFDYREFNNLVEVRQGGKMIYRDNVQFEPEMMDISGLGMYEGYTHFGNQIYFNIERSEDWISEVNNLLKDAEEMEGSVTTTGNGDVVVRVMGYNADPIEKFFRKIKDLQA
ncbi:MAG: urease accessory protein UreD [Lachnospiraceae bacterium]|nr:urease accessory protein UreD [Lachnospiraceae bacterium]